LDEAYAGERRTRALECRSLGVNLSIKHDALIGRCSLTIHMYPNLRRHAVFSFENSVEQCGDSQYV
jgi:hypothetical protein